MRNTSVYTALILLIVITTALASCGKKNVEPAPEPPPKAREDIDPSPSKVVEEFLSALKSADYEKAYKYVYAPYTDKDGYISQMKATISDNDVSILSYKLLATQIYDRTSTVVVELSTRRKSLKTGQIRDFTSRSVYDLGLFEDKWLVTTDRCIKNCSETEPGIEIKE